MLRLKQRLLAHFCIVGLSLLAAATACAQPFMMRHTFDDPDGTSRNNFGYSVALDGAAVLIGAPQWGSDVGQAYLFDATTGSLLQTFDEPSITGSDNFGYSVALDENRVLVGGYGDDQAHLFDATTGNLLRTFDDPLFTPSDPTWFGSSVALDGNRVLIGAHGDDTAGRFVGRAYLFDATTGNLIHSFDDPTVTTGDHFGISVALAGNRVLIGASWDATNAEYGGQAHLFDATTGNLLHTFDDPTPGEDNQFGTSIALDGNRVLIGETFDSGGVVGQAHLFDGTTYTLLRTFDDPTPTGDDRFGYSVALDGNRVLVGAPHDSSHGETIGQAYLFDATMGNLIQTFDHPFPIGHYDFGNSVDLDGHRVLIGAYWRDGRAYIFTPTGDFNSDAKCDLNDLNAILAEGPIVAGVAVTPGVNDQFDLTGDGVISMDDVDQWLADAATINGFGSPYKRGDANLDGLVNVSDFNDWHANKFTETLSWDLGNFNGDGITDVSDFNDWNANKFTTSDRMFAVPEPAVVWVLVLLISVEMVRRRF